MDFNQYYLNQALGTTNYPVFRGALIQRGYGLGGVFKQFFSWVIPLIKQHATPVMKNIGKELVSNVSNIANDAIEGKDVKESAKENFKKSFEKLTKVQQGNGYKRKLTSRNLKKQTSKQKKFSDIFSNKNDSFY